MTCSDLKELRHFEITLEHLPPPELNPNQLRRLHWTERRKVTDIARQEIGWMAKTIWHDKPMVKVQVSYKFTVKDGRRHDVDNLVSACKPYIDGLIDVNVLMSDDYRYMSIGGASIERGEKDFTQISVKEVICKG